MKNSSKITLAMLAATLAACAESPMAPSVDASQVHAESYGVGATQALTRDDTVKFHITIDPSRETIYSLGDGNTIRFPAGSLCDPSNSSYGESEWDSPCVQATSPLTVNVTAWLDSKGHARVDFDQHVRFVPSSNPNQWVVITFSDAEASLDPVFNILYCASRWGRCKDESRRDPSLLPTKNPLTGKIERRIKHFSGYNVAAGRDAEEESGGQGDSYWGALAPSNSARVALVKPLSRKANVELPREKIRFEEGLSGYILASG